MFLVLSADRAMGAAPIARSALRTRNITLLHGDVLHARGVCFSAHMRRIAARRSSCLIAKSSRAGAGASLGSGERCWVAIGARPHVK